MADLPIAVIDVGSNSGRLVVVRSVAGCHLETLEEGRSALRLAVETDESGALTETAIARTVAALIDFRALAAGAGAARLIVVATAAVRDAPNREEFIRRVHEATGINIDVLDGEQEASYGFLGAVPGLPIAHGYVLDVGGGSLELTRFRDRELVRSAVFPLGALRVTKQFLTSDPPKAAEVRKLVRYVREALADMPRLDQDEHLVGTGGTVRNLAKVDRRTRTYPISRLHGYVLPRAAVSSLAELLSRRSIKARAATPGLGGHRADSIAGGALVIVTIMEVLGAEELVVSGYGLREGIALWALDHRLPDLDEVRRASIVALTTRFGVGQSPHAERRAEIACQLQDALAPTTDPGMREAVRYAALVLDIGRAVDYYNRLSHTSAILLVADLHGFSHRDIAVLAALVDGVDHHGVDLSRYAPLLSEDDHQAIEQGAAILDCACEIERRTPLDTPLALRVEQQNDQRFVITLPASIPIARQLTQRLEQAFGYAVTVTDTGEEAEAP